MNLDIFYMQITSVGLLALAAHFGGKITRKLHIGEVVGQVLGGMVAGPVILFFFEHKMPGYRAALQSVHFLTFIFLSIVAFGIGDELNFKKLKATGKDALLMSVIESLFTWICVTTTFILLGFKPITALIIGSIGIATAPASTFVIMNKLEITGKMRSMLGGIVVLDDVIEIIFFSITCQAALLLDKGTSFSLGNLISPVTKDLFFAILIGAIVFLMLRVMVERRWLNSKDEKEKSGGIPGPEFLSRLISEMPGPSVEVFIIVAACVSIGVGAALHLHLPFLITAVAAGILISNFYTTQVFESLRIENATSMYTLAFFALIGANADIEALFHAENLLFVGAYILARSTGKLSGTWIGCKITKQEKRLTQTLPKLMLPQAGVAAIEAFFVATVLGQTGQTILGIILPGIIFFEVVGILVSERTLMKWRSWITGGGDLIGYEELLRNKLMKEKFTITTLLHPECLIIPFNVHSKGEAIWELIRTLQSAGFISNGGEVLDIILERERQGGTTIGEGISILHGRIPNLQNPAIALGVLPNHGINFGGSNDKPVNIVYMVLSPADKPELHLQILAAIARLLSKKTVRQNLRNATNALEAIEIIKENA